MTASLKRQTGEWGEGFFLFLKTELALADVAQWIECWPENHRDACSIPSQGHKPELQARSPVEGAREATTHWYFSPSLSLKINKIL